MKTYVGIVRDHSSSMSSHKTNALKDYNSIVQSIKDGVATTNVETLVSVVECADKARLVTRHMSAGVLSPLGDYYANGMTALYDSIGELITLFENVPDRFDHDVSFLIMAVTDGEENQSWAWKNPAKLRIKIEELTATDKWTFALRVPKGYRDRLVRTLGIEVGNVLEWEQSERGYQEAIASTSSGFQEYYSARSVGATSTKKFFSNIDTVKVSRNLHTMIDVSKECQLHVVREPAGMAISPWFNKIFYKTYVKGSIFYELTKTETIQPSKQIAIRDKNTGVVYTGKNARDLLNLPHGEYFKLTPGQQANYDIFIQSMSVNRKLMDQQKVLYWPR